MKRLGIGHDWAHCNGNDCSVKENCIRYLLHLEAKDGGFTYLTYVRTEQKGDECKYFWEVDK